MTSPQDIEHFFQVAKTLTLEAAEVIRRSINEKKEVETKTSEWDLVTKYDREIERILFDNLSKEFPDHKFIGEETSSAEKKIPVLTNSPTWIIDPIDGTTNFVHSFPQNCISIGLAIDKNIVIGIVYNPSYDEMYTAIKGQGAFLNGKPIRTSSVTELKKALVNFELGLIARQPTRDIGLGRLEALLNVAHGVRAIGSAALALCLVARGAMEAFLMDGLKPWDVAAGFLLITEAGGTVINVKDDSFDIMTPKLIAAANKTLVAEISQLVIETDVKTLQTRNSLQK